jgi:hypothetical protein
MSPPPFHSGGADPSRQREFGPMAFMFVNSGRQVAKRCCPSLRYPHRCRGCEPTIKVYQPGRSTLFSEVFKT